MSILAKWLTDPKKPTLKLKWLRPKRKRQRICWPEGRNWLEMEVKKGKIQARVTEFSTFSQRSVRKAR
jgi:hypothetical protein